MKILIALCLSSLLALPAAAALKLSPADAAAKAQSFADGRVMKVRPFRGQGYMVRVLDEGRMRAIWVDGQSGETMPAKRYLKQQGIDPRELRKHKMKHKQGKGEGKGRRF